MEILQITKKILVIRNQRVLLDRDLAEIYGVETKVLNQSVKRNIERFRGDDFMFQLTKKEILECSRSQFATLNDEVSRSQIVTLNKKRGSNIKYAPFAFTELGVAMLSGVLNSEVAIKTNRNIMRAFVMMRQFVQDYAELNRKLDDFMAATGTQFNEVYQILTELVEQKKIEEKPRKRIGFVQKNAQNF
jgi:hypothetical protein